MCAAVHEACDKFLTDMPMAMQTDEGRAHILKAVIKWVARQTVAFANGDPSVLVDQMTRCLNEPDNEARIVAYLQRAELETPPPMDRAVH